MKRKWFSINGEHGFYLPFILVVAIVTLSTATTSILIYQNEIDATNLLLQQLEVETMRQVVIEKFIDEKMFIENESGEFQYELPYSKAVGNYQLKEEGVFIEFQIKTETLTYDFIH